MKTFDITPYTKEEGERFGVVLSKLGVPSFGPAVGNHLLRIVQGIDDLIKERGSSLDDNQKHLILGYRARLLDVCCVAAGQQKQILDTLTQFVEGQKTQCCERDHNHDGNCDRHPSPSSSPLKGRQILGL